MQAEVAEVEAEEAEVLLAEGELCPAPLPAIPDWFFNLERRDVDKKVSSRSLSAKQ